MPNIADQQDLNIHRLRLMAKFSGQLGRLGLGLFGRFWILYGCFGGPQWSHWIGSTFEIQMAWFSARKVDSGSSSDWFSWILRFPEKLSWLPDMVFVVFSARVLPNSHCRELWSEPKRCATKSYAHSWWYHLEKCLLWPFRAHLRFWNFGHFLKVRSLFRSQKLQKSVH